MQSGYNPEEDEFDKLLEKAIKIAYVQNQYNKIAGLPYNKPVRVYKFKSEFKVYQKRVHKLTEKNIHLIEGISKRGFKSYHVDHKISIYYGFKNKIHPEHIADITNLRMLYYKDNILKNKLCFIDEYNKWILEAVEISVSNSLGEFVRDFSAQSSQK
jgi:hypothetical protein